MSVRLWLRDRRVAVAIVVLALIAGTAQLFLWWTAPVTANHDFVGPPRSGYTLYDARVTDLNSLGKPSLHLQSPRVDRREGEDSLYLTSPTFQLPARQANVPDWHGKSLYGWVNKAGTLMKLQGPVEMHRPAYGTTAATDMYTADVIAWPKENRLATAAPARITQGTSTMRGIGMRANLTNKHLELLDDVHSTFTPAKKAR